MALVGVGCGGRLGSAPAESEDALKGAVVLTVGTVTASTVALSWRTSSITPTQFTLQRGLSTSSFATLATLSAGTTSYIDSTVSAATTYYYRVLATAGGRLDSSPDVVVLTSTADSCGDGVCGDSESCTGCTADCGACPSSLIDSWRFDESAGQALLDSAGTSNGVLGTTSAVEASDPTRVTGHSAGALQFNGSNQLATFPSGTPQLAFTYVAWIYPTGWGPSGYGRIFSKESSTGFDNFYLCVGGSTATLQATFGTGTAQEIGASNAIALNAWQQIAVSYDDGGDRILHLYVNGKEIAYAAESAQTTAVSAVSNPFLVGNRPAQDRGFQGMIDDVQVYGGALSASAIAALYRAPSTAPDMAQPPPPDMAQPAQVYTITVTKSGSGSGTVSGGTISCGTSCTESLVSGSSVTLTATAASGATFTGWSGACSGTGSCDVTVNANTSVTATFGAIPTATCPTGSPTYHVSTSGSDSNAGTQSAPFRTITHAYSKAAAGTVIIVAPGTYTDYQSGWGLHLGASGTATAPIYLCSQTRGGAIIDGQNAADRNQGLYIDGSYNVVDGFVITRGTLGGMSIWANGNQILRNEIHHNGNTSIETTTPTDGQCGVYSDAGTSGNIYDQNFIHDNGRQTDPTNYKYDHGLYLCGNNELVTDNIVDHNAAIGLQIAGYTTVTNMKVYNNVFSFNGSAGMVLWMALNGVDIKNNIIFGNQKYGIYDCGATGGGVVIDHDLIYGNNVSNGGYANIALTDQCGASTSFGYMLGTVVAADPSFANSSTSYSAATDFQLQSGSPAIDAGLTLTTVPVDYAGSPRPQGAGNDIGAYDR